jgi:hypothetical protein
MVAKSGIGLAQLAATGVDPQTRTVTLADGTRLVYERLVVAPGIDIRWDALAGCGEASAERIPHAWKAGEQTSLLRRQLQAMEDGGLVVMSAPANPFRCPPGPYERASLIAHYLKTKKPRSKLILLDAKDAFSKQKLFQNAWQELYPGLLEWVSVSAGGKVVSVDLAALALTTDFQTYRAAVANVIPPKKAGRVAELAGVTDRSGWCPINPVTFESTLQPNVHVIGGRSDCRRNAEISICRQCSGQGLRRGNRNIARRRDATDAEADQHVLQPGRTRLRHFDRRGTSWPTGSWPRSRARVGSVRSMRQPRRGTKRRSTRRAGSAPSPRKSSAERWRLDG